MLTTEIFSNGSYFMISRITEQMQVTPVFMIDVKIFTKIVLHDFSQKYSMIFLIRKSLHE